MLLVIASVVPLLGFALGYQYIEYRRDIAATGDQLLTLTRSMTRLVDALLQARISALETLATSSALEADDVDRFRLRAAAVSNRFPGANILLLRENGQNVMNLRVAPGNPLPKRPNLGSIQRVFATGEPQVSNLFESAAIHQPIVAIDVPVKRADGRIAYVLSMNPPLDVFAEVIRSQHLPETWIASVVDGRGVNVARFPRSDEFVGRQASASFLASLLSKHEGILESTSLEGIRLLSAFSHGKFGWAVGIGVSRESLIAPVVSQAGNMLAVGGALLAIALVLALYAARGIARPIESLRRLAAATDRDALSDMAPTGLPEVDEVAQALQTAESERRRSRQAEVTLRDGIETIPEGFSIYDGEDRLVMCNDRYRHLSADTPDQVVLGIRYEDFLRGGMARGRYPQARGQEEEWLAARLREHRDPAGAMEQQLADGRWVLITKRRLSNGWIAGLRVDISQFKAAEQALRIGEQRFRRVVESVANAIIMVDADGIIEMVNAQAEKIFGYPRAELVGQPIERLLPERHRSDHPGLRNTFFAAPQARPMGIGRELYALRRDGTEFPVEIGLSPIEAEHGTKVLASIVDITARRQVERIQAYYAAIVESTADAIIAKDLDGVVTSWNRAAELIFGYTAIEIIGQPIIRLLPADHLDEEITILAQIRRGERIEHFETVRCRKDGTEFPVSLTISPILGPDGEIIGASKIVRDITARKAVEQALSSSEEQLRNAQRVVHLGSGVRNLVTNESEWSDEIYRIFGVSRETYVASVENFLRLVHPDDRAAVLVTQEEIRQGICPQPSEYRIIRPDGTVRYVHRENELVRDSAGNPVRLETTIQDVTERRQTEEQLRQAQKMEAIGNLTGGMAHDFNNLLGVIIGNLGLARDRLSPDEEVHEVVGEALEAAWRGAELTRSLLAFSRRQPLRPARIDLNELVNNTVRLLGRLLGEDIEIVLTLADGIWPIIADPAQLEASLANLATNARDAMPRGGRLIITTANRHLDRDYAAMHVDVIPGDFAMIEVSDTGVGMSADVAKQIFEPFFTTKEAGQGTGLGLSMVFGFLRQSGGHVNVYSEPGAGTTFRLYLPRATTEGVLPGEVLDDRSAVRGSGETVLVVEDNSGMRRVVLRQLRELGYQVLECDRAAAGLELLQRQHVDLLLTDIVMPGGLDGVELARLALERWPALKIVLTSGFPEARINGDGGSLGGLQLLSKPYSKEQLAAVLRAVLDR